MNTIMKEGIVHSLVKYSVDDAMDRWRKWRSWEGIDGRLGDYFTTL